METNILNLDYSDNPEALRVLEMIENTKKNIFLSGKGGVGKTHLIKYIMQTTKKNAVLAAPTGIAAVNVGGQTLHSLLGLPTSPYVPDVDAKGEYIPAGKQNPSLISCWNKNKISLFKKIDLLIIDEISMVRSDVLDMVSDALCCFRNTSIPFGGVQLLMVGDLFQLPPVVDTKQKELLNNVYNTEFFFDSLALKKYGFECVQLQKVYRQKDDHFIGILNNIRLGFYVESDFKSLNTRYYPRMYGETFSANETVLCSRKDEAARVNQQGLATLSTPERIYQAEIDGDFTKSKMPCEEYLRLKIGAKIMLAENDWENGYQNGTMGIIENMTDTSIQVRLYDGKVVNISKKVWYSVEHYFGENGKILQRTTGSCIQFPIRLAYAITIHKSQGLTFDQITIDPYCIFAEGQLYVALSRARSLQGIRLLNQVTKRHIKISQPVLNFYLKVFGADMLLDM
jgi:ATP-dependent exoDNAse (exonuclease V) alpha subunit